MNHTSHTTTRRWTKSFCSQLYILFVFLSLNIVGLAQESLPLNWENIYTQNYSAGSAVLSPDGKWVAVTARTKQQRGIFIKEVDSEQAPQFWVAGGSPAWFADGE